MARRPANWSVVTCSQLNEIPGAKIGLYRDSKQTKRTNFYVPAPTKVHPQIWLTNWISFLERAHTVT